MDLSGESAPHKVALHPLKRVLFPTYSTRTGLSFPPDYKHPEGRHLEIRSSSPRGLSPTDQLPSSPLCSHSIRVNHEIVPSPETEINGLLWKEN